MKGKFACLYKRRYASREEADQELSRMVQRRREAGTMEGSPRVFRCGVCDGWHHGRPKRRRR